ncbi:MAG: isopenicillin N synthase family dioxygenase [Rhodospirillaceae bacterium]
MHDVPVIDIGAFEGGDVAARARIAGAVARAVEEIGFLTITGHGVPAPVIDATRRAAWDLFRLPEEAKQRWRHPSGNNNRGYTPMEAEHNGSSGGVKAPADLREGFIFGPFDLPDAPRFTGPAAAYAYAPNIWPDAAPGVTAAFQAYYRAVDGFNTRLLRVFATALGLPADYFADTFDHHASVVRMLHYPAQAEAPPLGQLRCGAHSDFGSHTILLADDAPGGLQVRTRAGVWVDVVPPRDAFIINIGDMMMMWTNDRWLSNLHRVVNPPVRHDRSTERLSIAFFVHPRPDATIECIPTCRADGAPAHHQPVLAGDYRRMKVGSTVAAAQ